MAIVQPVNRSKPGNIPVEGGGGTPRAEHPVLQAAEGVTVSRVRVFVNVHAYDHAGALRTVGLGEWR